MGYITGTDLQAALSPATYLAVFDDSNVGTVNTSAVALVIERAHAEVASYLPRITRTYPGAIPSAVQSLLRAAELEYAMAFAFERHPEYVRSFGEGPRLDMFKRAQARMEAIATGAQFATGDAVAPLNPAPVTGGIVVVSGPRMLVDSLDGTSNGGDF